MDVRFCTECGSPLNEQGLVPPPLLAPPHPKVHNDNKESDLYLNSYAEKAKRMVPECVNPDLDEVQIKQYDIARLQTLIKGAFAEKRL